MQFLSRSSCYFKIARVNQMQFSVRFVAAISQGFRTYLKLVATSARQKLHRVAVTKIACVNGPLRIKDQITFIARVLWSLLGSFRLDHEYEIEYECDISILVFRLTLSQHMPISKLLFVGHFSFNRNNIQTAVINITKQCML